MMASQLALLLVTDQSRIDQLGNHFKTANTPTLQNFGGWLPILILLLVLAAATVLAWFVVRWLRKREYHNPKQLFTQLCRVHQLNRQQQLLLGELAKQPEVGVPADLFMDANWFETHRLPKSLLAQSAAVDEIKQILFDD